MISIETFEEIVEFIVEMYPQYKNVNIQINTLNEVLIKLKNEGIQHLIENFVHKDYWPDDDILGQLDDYIEISNT